MIRTMAVGVGGTGGWHAFGWASGQALLTATRLVILHVCAPGSPLARPGTPSLARLEVVDPPLAKAVATARANLGERNVSLRILEGDPGAALADASAGVGTLVVGAGGGGSTLRRLIRHADCPVVVIRPHPGEHDAPFAGQVVVGVDTGPACGAALEYAFEHADQHDLTVTAVRVIETDRSAEVSRTDDLVAATRLLRHEVQPWRLKYPHVRVQSTVLHDEVGTGLIRAGAGARLLVIGDRHRGVLGRARTGDIPLTVARGARGCVAVVPPDRQEKDLP